MFSQSYVDMVISWCCGCNMLLVVPSPGRLFFWCVCVCVCVCVWVCLKGTSHGLVSFAVRRSAWKTSWTERSHRAASYKRPFEWAADCCVQRWRCLLTCQVREIFTPWRDNVYTKHCKQFFSTVYSLLYNCDSAESILRDVCCSFVYVSTVYMSLYISCTLYLCIFDIILYINVC